MRSRKVGKQKYLKHIKQQHRLMSQHKKQQQTYIQDILAALESQGVQHLMFYEGQSLVHGYVDIEGMTVRKDMVEAYSYATSGHPSDLLKSVIAYLVPWKTMDQFKEFESAAGCYIPAVERILVKKGKNGSIVSKSKVAKFLMKHSIEVSEEDAFVHELYHAVSHATGRKTRKFVSLEEEFVYTRTIKWFLNKGYSENEVVEQYFFPFVMQDVLKSKKNEIVLEIADEMGLVITQDQVSDFDFVNNFIEDHAESFVSKAAVRARAMGRKMLQSASEYSLREKQDRFSLLDFN